MPPHFKEKFFESIQMVFVWKYNTNGFFIPFVLAMAVLYNKCWYRLIIDYIIHNILSYLYPLLWTFNSTVVAGGQYYVLLLEHYITDIMDWTIGAVCSMIPELTYHQWHTRLPAVHLVTQVTRGSSDTIHRAEVLT